MEKLFAITSHIIHGKGFGRTIGFPTINLMYPEHNEIESGVYVCRVELPDAVYMGAMHLGPRRTVDDETTFEVHLFDFEDDADGDLKNVEAYVEVFEKLREVEKFDSPEALKDQIEVDVKNAKAYIEKYGLSNI